MRYRIGVTSMFIPASDRNVNLVNANNIGW
jgi:hypothetical protein